MVRRTVIRILAFILLSALPAAATVDGWPALHDVEGVAADDVLNIRSAPNASSAIIGSLEHDATNIEVIRPTDDLTWGLVNIGEATGWVSMAFLQRHPGQWDGAFPNIRQCFGTEPFWSLTFEPPRVVFSSSETEAREGLISGMHASLARRDRFAFTGAFFPTDAGHRDLHMFVRTETCTDGMSDREYGIAIDMLLTRPTTEGDDSATGLYSGCCSIQPRAASR